MPVLDSAHAAGSTAVSSRQSDALNENARISLDEEFCELGRYGLIELKKGTDPNFPIGMSTRTCEDQRCWDFVIRW